ncbi:470_t:CDS:2, partial [Funneliformis mosseae]
MVLHEMNQSSSLWPGGSRLRGGEHFNLQYNSFSRKNDLYKGFEVILYKSKTNQRGVDNIESQ